MKIMKKILLSLFAVLLSCSAWAENVEIDGINYSLNEETKEASVIEKTPKYSGDIVIPSSVVYSNLTYSVTSIGKGAFNRCRKFSVKIPNSVVSIGESAFEYSSLSSIEIPNSVTSIGYRAFQNCSSLTSIEIPNSVTSIDKEAFSQCYYLASIDIPNSVTSIGRYAFFSTTWYDNQPEGLVYAGRVAYKYKGTMPENTSIVIKDGTTAISGSAFEGYTGLTSIEMPNSIKSIGDWAFGGCSGLKSINFPNGFTSIGDYVFQGCTSLTSIVIPHSATRIGYQAFYDCTALTSVEILNDATSIGGKAFFNTAWYNNYPYGMVYIGKVAYSYKGSMPSNTSIGLKEGTTEISDEAFSRRTDLISIEIPNSVTYIGNSVFMNCSGLTSIICEAITPPTLGTYVFDKVDKSACILYVSSQSVEAYKSADQWKDFNSILPIDPTGINAIENVQLANDKFFDYDGREIPLPQKGVNIVKKANGQTIKVFVR